MEKLIDLLNEYEKEREMEIGTFELGKIPYREWSLDMGDLVFEPNYKDKKYEDCVGDTANSVLISKSFGFIKWLVENDKIDRNKLEIRPFSDGLVYSDSDCTVYRNDTTYEMLLMLLSISNSPIEDLISYLK